MNTRSRKRGVETKGTSQVHMDVPHYIGKYEAKVELPIAKHWSTHDSLKSLEVEMTKTANMLAVGQKLLGTKQHEQLQHAFFTFLIITAVTEHGQKKTTEGTTK